MIPIINMPQSLSKLVTHIIFSTKNRVPFLIDRNIRQEMHSYLGGSCNKLDCPVITVGGSADHIHILCYLSRNLSVSNLVREIKRESSKWVKTKGKVLIKFAWQNGYGAFSVGQTEIKRVKEYITRQEAHHKKKTFQDEYLEFLKSHKIKYDEQYLWD
jgi:putative transposase